MRDFKSTSGTVLPHRFITIGRAIAAILLQPLHWISCGLAMCLAVFLAGALIIIEQKVARGGHAGRHRTA